jgi:hypothetical protein
MEAAEGVGQVPHDVVADAGRELKIGSRQGRLLEWRRQSTNRSSASTVVSGPAPTHSRPGTIPHANRSVVTSDLIYWDFFFMFYSTGFCTA